MANPADPKWYLTSTDQDSPLSHTAHRFRDRYSDYTICGRLALFGDHDLAKGKPRCKRCAKGGERGK